LTGPIRNSVRTEATRERVLQAALRAIAANGYQRSALAAIAADAGLTTAGLLHHFPSKERLLVAVLAERDRLDGLRFHLREVQGLEVLDRLRQLVEHNAEVPRLVQAFTVLMGESVAEEHPAREWFAERYPHRRANLAAALRAGIDAGQIRADLDCDALAAQIIAMMDGLQVQWALNREQVDLVSAFSHYIEGVRRDIARP
jgi:AcrR family transcriptional regulator